ncbi:hypothetical protein FRB93_000526 [Tulasnella sp. JGI-2019a]|nr:hypothetical protein FRB93_000526 [Tulasnella sp. JGI-2019a]
MHKLDGLELKAYRDLEAEGLTKEAAHQGMAARADKLLQMNFVKPIMDMPHPPVAYVSFKGTWKPGSRYRSISAESSISFLLSKSDAHLVTIPDPARSVGWGGFCDLFLGIHVSTGRKLAMKRPKLSTDNASEVADATRRFVREADTWSSLTHDNILPFYGVMKISNEMYLISPWMEYGDLSRFLADRLSFLKTPGDLRDRDKNPRKIAYRGFIESDALHGVASGLAYLHTHDVVVHGDLKASNVLLNEQLMPRICDFGLSKIKDGHSATSTGMQGAGSWRWMSPEVMDGGPKTFESDIYAFGMTIVEVSKVYYPQWFGADLLVDRS